MEYAYKQLVVVVHEKSTAVAERIEHDARLGECEQDGSRAEWAAYCTFQHYVLRTGSSGMSARFVSKASNPLRTSRALAASNIIY